MLPTTIYRHSIAGKKGGHVQPKAPAIAITQPGRLRTAHVLALCGVSHSTLYARIAANEFPPPDGKDGSLNYWNTATILQYLQTSSAGRQQ
jgi:predicted DNA-binding transcriptional regulator AlpA